MTRSAGESSNWFRICVIDSIWPSAEALSADDLTRLQTRHEEELAAIAEYQPDDSQPGFSAIVDDLKMLMKQEDERRASVDSRLSTLISLTSTASAIVMAIVVFLTTRNPENFTISSVIWVSCLAFYILLQLFRAVWAAVGGLERRGYQNLTPSMLIPNKEFFPQKDRAKQLLQCLHHNQEVNNSKVTQMAIAHRALKNSLAVFLIAGALLTITAITRSAQRQQTTMRESLPTYESASVA